ncbi:SSI family serine proteinase inhibitor [Streptantibioticus silvisoli]|uniref:SSI family serine proteinase inhibitor n=1 Tax=Streptantibioticus silvisoli TaxID=2705255 RepID=A0ABT6W9P4_9ACTN|nr:SSI family serine proteinase inhibitor [Streptantibioticus silvisoli]MDI5967486.1 SSI family serine proteinase inhibitor [Streptantibioticus silvisoli]
MFRIARSIVIGLVLCTASSAIGLAPAAAAPHRTPRPAYTAPRPVGELAAADRASTGRPAQSAVHRHSPPHSRTPTRTPTGSHRTPARTPADSPRAPVRTLPAPHPDLLTVRLDDGHRVISSRSLRCHPDGGSMRGAAAACRRLDALGGPVGPTPKREMCSMVYGGPQTARITGTWHGRRVDQTYSRSNGCQTARWQRMAPVLPGVSGVSNGGSP